MMVALNPEVIAERVHPEIAGVFASSAGFPPGEFHESVAFPIFGTAGNYGMMGILKGARAAEHGATEARK